MLVLSSDYHGEKQMKLGACLDFFLGLHQDMFILCSKKLFLYLLSPKNLVLYNP